MQLYRKAATALGGACNVVELETEEHAKALGPQKAIVIDSKKTFADFVRRQASVTRERTARETYRS